MLDKNKYYEIQNRASDGCKLYAFITIRRYCSYGRKSDNLGCKGVLINAVQQECIYDIRQRKNERARMVKIRQKNGQTREYFKILYTR